MGMRRYFTSGDLLGARLAAARQDYIRAAGRVAAPRPECYSRLEAGGNFGHCYTPSIAADCVDRWRVAMPKVPSRFKTTVALGPRRRDTASGADVVLPGSSKPCAEEVTAREVPPHAHRGGVARTVGLRQDPLQPHRELGARPLAGRHRHRGRRHACLLYTSDAAD